MEQRLSLVTLGTRDLKKATAFYQAIGFTPHPRSSEDITFFQMNGMVFGLYGLEALAEEASGGEIGTGFGGMTISYNTRTRDEVDTFIAEAVKAGPEWMAIRIIPVNAIALGHRNAEQFGKFDEFRIGAGACDFGTDRDHRFLGLKQ